MIIAKNTLIAANRNTRGIRDDCFDFPTAGSTNNLSTSYCGRYVTVTDDARIGPAGLYGGATATAPLLAGSPAKDIGDSAVCAVPPVNNLDQRGSVRPQGSDGNSEAVCDIGAYEAPDSAMPVTCASLLV